MSATNTPGPWQSQKRSSIRPSLPEAFEMLDENDIKETSAKTEAVDAPAEKEEVEALAKTQTVETF